MPYIDIGQKTHDIGHCRRCNFQWVIAPGTRGERGSTKNTYNGQRCPFCGSGSVYYEQESNR